MGEFWGLEYWMENISIVQGERQFFASAACQKEVFPRENLYDSYLQSEFYDTYRQKGHTLEDVYAFAVNEAAEGQVYLDLNPSNLTITF